PYTTLFRSVAESRLGRAPPQRQGNDIHSRRVEAELLFHLFFHIPATGNDTLCLAHRLLLIEVAMILVTIVTAVDVILLDLPMRTMDKADNGKLQMLGKKHPPALYYPCPRLKVQRQYDIKRAVAVQLGDLA